MIKAWLVPAEESHMGFPRLIVATSLIIATSLGCSTLNTASDSARVRDSILSNLNSAPESMSPPNFDPANPTIDPTYLRSQADYHFTLGESYSFEGKSQKAVEEYKLTLVYDAKAPLVRVRLAAEYVRLGLFTEAIEQADLALKENPDSLEARSVLGGLYSSMKMYDQALEQYDAILKIKPDSAETMVYIGAILAEQKRFEEAIRNFTKMTKLKGVLAAQAYYYMGRVYADWGNHYNDAEKAFKNAIKLKPEFAEATQALAQIQFEAGKEAEAMRLLESYQDHFGPNKEISKILGQYYLDKSDYTKALESLEQVEGFERDNLNIKVKIALLLIEKKQYTKAASRLQEILRQAPELDKIRFYLAAVYEEIKDVDAAISNYLSLPASSSYFGEAMIHAAFLCKKSSDMDRATEVITSAIAQRSDIPELYAFYASLLEDQKEYVKAVEMLTAAVAKFPDHTQLRFFLGTMEDRVGKTENSIAQMQKILEIDGKHVQALNFLAYTYAEMNKNLDEAEGLARRALALQPNDGYLLDTLGWILFKQGKTEASVPWLEAAFKHKSTESVIAEHLGDAYYRLQLVEKAKKMYRRAAEIETDAAKIQQIHQKIVATDEQRMPASQPTPQNP